MKRGRIRELIAAYGADPARWPKAESATARALAANDPELIAARWIDTLLAQFKTPPVDPALVERIVARADALNQEAPRVARTGGLLSLFRHPLAVARLPWPELAAMTAALILGFYIGISGIGYPSQLTSSGQVAGNLSGASDLLLASGAPASPRSNNLFP